MPHGPFAMSQAGLTLRHFSRLGHLHFSLQCRLRSEGHPIPSMLRLVWKCALRLLYIGVNDEWLGGWGRGELIKILRPRQRVCRELTWWWWTGLRVSKQVLSFLRDLAFGETHADPLGRVLIQRVPYLFPGLQQSKVESVTECRDWGWGWGSLPAFSGLLELFPFCFQSFFLFGPCHAVTICQTVILACL